MMIKEDAEAQLTFMIKEDVEAQLTSHCIPLGRTMGANGVFPTSCMMIAQATDYP